MCRQSATWLSFRSDKNIMRSTLTIRRLIVATGIVAFLLGAPHELLAQTVEPSTPDQANGQTRLAQALAAELMAAPSDVSFLVILDDQLDPAVAVQATTVQATATAAEDAAARRCLLYTSRCV